MVHLLCNADWGDVLVAALVLVLVHLRDSRRVQRLQAPQIWIHHNRKARHFP